MEGQLESLEQSLRCPCVHTLRLYVTCDDSSPKRLLFALPELAVSPPLRNGRFLELIWTSRLWFLDHEAVTLCPDRTANYSWTSLVREEFKKEGEKKRKKPDLFISLLYMEACRRIRPLCPSWSRKELLKEWPDYLDKEHTIVEICFGKFATDLGSKPRQCKLWNQISDRR